LLLRPRAARALLVLAHGAGAGMRHEFLEALAQALGVHGIATLRWEFPFMARQTVRRPRPRVDSPEVAEQAVRDVWRAAARLVRLPRFAGGKSFGGRMTTRAHAVAPLLGVCGIVLVGFPLHSPRVPSAERAEHLKRAAGPLLFVQGSRDELAELRLMRPVVAALGARATLHVLEGADHGFSRRGDLLHVASTIAAWIDMMLACGPAIRRGTRRS
jgi:predicted alpha/beta-hydrolase family hydrolase